MLLLSWWLLLALLPLRSRSASPLLWRLLHLPIRGRLRGLFLCLLHCPLLLWWTRLMLPWRHLLLLSIPARVRPGCRPPLLLLLHRSLLQSRHGILLLLLLLVAHSKCRTLLLSHVLSWRMLHRLLCRFRCLSTTALYGTGWSTAGKGIGKRIVQRTATAILPRCLPGTAGWRTARHGQGRLAARSSVIHRLFRGRFSDSGSGILRRPRRGRRGIRWRNGSIPLGDAALGIVVVRFPRGGIHVLLPRCREFCCCCCCFRSAVRGSRGIVAGGFLGRALRFNSGSGPRAAAGWFGRLLGLRRCLL